MIYRIFQQGQIIPDFLAFQVFSLQWGHVEKWLIQFWNRLLVRTKCTLCDFPNFSTKSNNSRFSSISGVFSALGARRKVVGTVLASYFSATFFPQNLNHDPMCAKIVPFPFPLRPINLV